jgi:hypothetical protein
MSSRYADQIKRLDTDISIIETRLFSNCVLFTNVYGTTYLTCVVRIQCVHFSKIANRELDFSDFVLAQYFHFPPDLSPLQNCPACPLVFLKHKRKRTFYYQSFFTGSGCHNHQHTQCISYFYSVVL